MTGSIRHMYFTADPLFDDLLEQHVNAAHVAANDHDSVIAALRAAPTLDEAREIFEILIADRQLPESLTDDFSEAIKAALVTVRSPKQPKPAAPIHSFEI